MARETETSTGAQRKATVDPSLSFPDYAVATHVTPQPGWLTLNVARERRFTGELLFATLPEIRVYTDAGVVYYAMRADDPPIGRQLVDAGALDSAQLERGTVRVGDVEHLGRLFDRDPSIDRDAVLVVVESTTEQVVNYLANSVTSPITINSYRHHPSGIHRWFVAPASAKLTRPVADVAQVDRSVVEDLPSVTPTLDVSIDWEQELPAPEGGPVTPGAAFPAPTTGPVDIEAELGEFDADDADWTAASPASTPPFGTDLASSLEDFTITWPDGTAEPARVDPPPSPIAMRPGGDIAPDAFAPTTDVVDQDDHDGQGPAVADARADADPFAASPAPVGPSESVGALAPPSPVTEPAPAPAPELTIDLTPVSDEPAATPGQPEPPASDDVSLGVTPLRLDQLPAPDATVPDDVADAVRRALQAIEGVSGSSAQLPKMDVAPISLPELHFGQGEARAASTTDADAATAVASSSDVAEAPTFAPPTPAASAFAPPTPDMRAEAIYARAAAEASNVATAGTGGVEVGTTEVPTDDGAPEPGQTSVVFLDDENGDDGDDDRRGALRRLIGSLRRKN